MCQALPWRRVGETRETGGVRSRDSVAHERSASWTEVLWPRPLTSRSSSGCCLALQVRALTGDSQVLSRSRGQDREPYCGSRRNHTSPPVFETAQVGSGSVTLVCKSRCALFSFEGTSSNLDLNIFWTVIPSQISKLKGCAVRTWLASQASISGFLYRRSIN